MLDIFESMLGFLSFDCCAHRSLYCRLISKLKYIQDDEKQFHEQVCRVSVEFIFICSFNTKLDKFCYCFNFQPHCIFLQKSNAYVLNFIFENVYLKYKLLKRRRRRYGFHPIVEQIACISNFFPQFIYNFSSV